MYRFSIVLLYPKIVPNFQICNDALVWSILLTVYRGSCVELTLNICTNTHEIIDTAQMSPIVSDLSSSVVESLTFMDFVILLPSQFSHFKSEITLNGIQLCFFVCRSGGKINHDGYKWVNCLWRIRFYTKNIFSVCLEILLPYATVSMYWY